MDRVCAVVGRCRIVRELTARLIAGERIVLTGSAGVGKSTVLDAVVSALTTEGSRAVVALRATPARGELPFGVLTPFLESVPASASVADAVHAVAAEIVDVAGGRPVAVAVDDWPLLDKDSMAVVDLLRERHGATVLAAMRTEDRAAELRAVTAARGFTQLELCELGHEDVARLATQLLGADLAAAAVSELWIRSRGNPLFVRELIAEGVECGALAELDGEWHFITPVEIPGRVADLIACRFGRLAPECRSALQLLAVGGELPRSFVGRMVPAAVLDQLSEGSWIVPTDTGNDGLAHPLVEEAIRAAATPAQLVATSRRLAESAGPECTDGLDVLQVARWHVVGGVDAPSALWRAAARRARVLAKLELATRFAESALAAAEGSGVAESLALVEIVTTAGDFRRAETVARRLQSAMTAAMGAEPAAVDQRWIDTFAIVVISRGHNAFWGVGDAAIARNATTDALGLLRSLDTSEADRRPAELELEAEQATYLAFSGSMTAANELAARVLADPACPARAEVRASFAAGIAHVQLGRPARSVAALRRGLAAVELMPTFGRGQFTTFLTSALVLAQIELGDPPAAVSLAIEGVDAANASGDVTRRSLASYALGRALLARGRARAAAAAFADATRLDLAFRAAGRSSWSLVGLLHAEAQCACFDEQRAATLTLELSGLPPNDTTFWNGEAERAAAWASAAAGAIPAAAEQFEAAYEVATASGQAAMAAWIAHDLLRVRGDRDDAKRVLAATAGLDVGVYPLLRRHGASALAGDGAALTDCAEAFADAGYDLLAAELWLTAGRRLHRNGDPTATATHDAGRQAMQRCGDVHSPALLVGLGLHQLTPRQLQIADLAASGLSNPGIADRLGLSVRTVANQLQRVYDTTGLRRADLPRAV